MHGNGGTLSSQATVILARRPDPERQCRSLYRGGRPHCGGRRNGALRDWHPADLGALVINALVKRAGIDGAAVEDVIAGCVSQVGEQSFHVGRNMVLASTLPPSVPAVTIDRQCGSSQQALHFAAQAVMSGTQDVVIAAGVEHMTRVPMGTPTLLAAQAGIGTGPWSETIQKRFGVSEFSQFTGAQMIADRYGFSREDLDVFALKSHHKAAAAEDAGAFLREIVPVPITDADGMETLHLHDEGIRRSRRWKDWPSSRRFSLMA